MGVVFTCSFDDGHPSDMKTAEILQKNCMKGTFYIPLENWEDPSILTRQQIRELGARFEIGSHTYGHCYLNSATAEEARRQIVGGKKQLEEILGGRIAGFCYPGGKYAERDIGFVKEAGFTYARTTKNLCIDAGENPFEIPTTIQFYPHHRSVYLRNFIRAGEWSKRSDGLRLALRHEDWMTRIYALFDYACEQGGVFHLWGHSKQLEERNAWQQFDDFLAYVASRVAVRDRLSNEQLAARRFSIKTPDMLITPKALASRARH